jgi:hypothetical protein
MAMVAAGCGGGGDGGSGSNGSTANGPSVNVVGLQSDGRSLAFFNANNASSITAQRSITGLQNGETLVAIDARVAPIGAQPSPTPGGNGVTGLYGVTNQKRLYLITSDDNSATATQVGSAPFDFEGGVPALTDPGFDFNPVPDRIRLVQGTFNARLNPNNGAAVDAQPTPCRGAA